ncbi:NUDIX hydrolase domain-like protein [Gongronella butleri]|nr:NUDIX hydrolase domain-like protein [Gongronella butleri]
MAFSSFLEVVQHCDKVSYDTASPGARLLLEDDVCVGTILSNVLPELAAYCQATSPAPFVVTDTTVRFSDHVRTVDDRTQAVKTLMDHWRATKKFAALAGWRDELYPVYGASGAPAFVMERAATPLFGISTFGVHVNVFVVDKGVTKMWVARRSMQKQTWPGVLDNCVAGGIPHGYSTKETVVKECDEEASIPENLAQNAKNVSVVSYYTFSDYGMQPETEYIYDLQLPVDFAPTPKDGEVECFYLWTLDEVKQSIFNDGWKPNCALVAIEFMIRHGYIHADNEPDYIDISYHLHRRLEFPGPKKSLEIK